MALKVLCAVLGLAVLLAGCTTPPPPEKGLATSVAITSAPADAAPDSKATVCWRVEGSGRVDHTALHFGNQSRTSGSVAFTDYPNATYPNNRTSQDPAGYQLPGSFCSAVDVARSDVFVRAHVIDREGGLGKLGDETRIRVRGLVNVTPPTPTVFTGIVATVTFDMAGNATAPAGSNVTVCWTVTGTGLIPHTAVHPSSTSHVGETPTLALYNGTARYPNNETVQNPAGYQIPDTFCTGVPAPAAGQTIFLRAHAIDSTGRHTFSPDERSVTST